VTAADAVVAASHTWTFANGNFTVRDIGGTFAMSGATNANNNGVRIITAVTGPTTIVTDGTQTNETFATIANITAIVTDTAVADGYQVYGAVNKGAQTNAGATVSWAKQAGAITFKKLPSPGRIGNLSSIRNDGVGWVASTPAVPALTIPMTIGMVFSCDTFGVSGQHNSPCDGLTASRGGFFVDGATGAITMIGSGTPATGLTTTSGAYHMYVGVYNGASSFVRMDGVQSANISPGTTLLTGVSLFSLVTGLFPMTGEIVEYLNWTDATTPAQIEAYFQAKYGAFPQ
jgi:hypothetical protein